MRLREKQSCVNGWWNGVRTVLEILKEPKVPMRLVQVYNRGPRKGIIGLRQAGYFLVHPASRSPRRIHSAIDIHSALVGRSLFGAHR